MDRVDLERVCVCAFVRERKREEITLACFSCRNKLVGIKSSVREKIKLDESLS